MGPLWARIKTWSASPYTSGMSVWGWFLFLGMLVLIFAAWAEIFGYIKKDV